MMNNNKEDLTDATMQALQGNLKDNSNIGSDSRRRLKKLVEDYVTENKYKEVFDIKMDFILPTIEDTEIMKVLDDLQLKAYNTNANV